MKILLQSAPSFLGRALFAAGVAWTIAGCASTGPLAKQDANYPEDKVDARGLFLESCATCHGKDGRAKTFHGRLVGAQNLTDPAFQADISDQEIVRAIETGPRAMPAFRNKFSEAEIHALAAYVRTLKAPPRS